MRVILWLSGLVLLVIVIMYASGRTPAPLPVGALTAVPESRSGLELRIEKLERSVEDLRLIRARYGERILELEMKVKWLQKDVKDLKVGGVVEGSGPTITSTSTHTPIPPTRTPTFTPVPPVEQGGGKSALELYDFNGNGRITCAEAEVAGIAPVPTTHPAYPYMLDANENGVVCE